MKVPCSGIPATGLRIGACAAIALSLSACVTVIRGDGDTEGSEKRQMLQYVASRGPVLVETKGEGREPPALRSRLAEMANGALRDMELTFTGDPAQAGDPHYRFVLVFNPAVGVTERDLCQGGPSWVQRRIGETRLITSFCAGSGLIASSIATGPEITDPDDPLLAEIVRAGIAETIRGRATLGGHRP